MCRAFLHGDCPFSEHVTGTQLMLPSRASLRQMRFMSPRNGLSSRAWCSPCMGRNEHNL